MQFVCFGCVMESETKQKGRQGKRVRGNSTVI